MQPINLKLDAFEGSLDLLYYLIQKNEIDIYDIQIDLLTEQYLFYLEEAKQRNMESLSEFLLMAATLLEIKSKMLLPSKKEREESDVDPREELVAKLLEYQKFKNVAELFKEKEQDYSKLFYKDTDESVMKIIKENAPKDVSDFLSGITLDDIYQAFENVLKRKDLKTDKIRSAFNSVERDLYTIKDKMSYIKDLLILRKKLKFSEIFRAESPKIEKVVTFLALLELIKIKEINISQEKTFGEILIS